MIFQEIQVHILELLGCCVATLNESLFCKHKRNEMAFFTFFLPCLLVCLASVYHMLLKKDKSNFFSQKVSENNRMVKVGRNHCRSNLDTQTGLSTAGLQVRIQRASKDLLGRRFHDLSGKPMPVRSQSIYKF